MRCVYFHCFGVLPVDLLAEWCKNTIATREINLTTVFYRPPFPRVAATGEAALFFWALSGPTVRAGYAVLGREWRGVPSALNQRLINGALDRHSQYGQVLPMADLATRELAEPHQASPYDAERRLTIHSVADRS